MRGPLLVSAVACAVACTSGAPPAAPAALAPVMTAASVATVAAAPAPPTPALSASAASAPPADPSPEPTTAEWAGAKTSPDLSSRDRGCAVSRVREWVRLACEPKAPDGGDLIDILPGSVTRAAKLRSDAGARTLIDRVPEGAELTTEILWTDARFGFSVAVHGGRAIAGYERRRDDDRRERGVEAFGMACCAKVRGEQACVGKSGDFNAAICVQSYPKDCKKYLACVAHELPPRCPAGFLEDGDVCRKKCNPNAQAACAGVEPESPNELVVCVPFQAGFVCRDQH